MNDRYVYMLMDGSMLTNVVTSQGQMASNTRDVPVFCFGIGGELVCEYPSIRRAAAATKISAGSIVCCCKGRYNTAGGYVWSYTCEFPGYTPTSAWNRRSVDCYTEDLTFVRMYASASEAAQHLNISEHQINKCVRGKGYTAGGYVWVKHGDTPTPHKKLAAGRPKRSIGQYDKDDKLINVFESLTGARDITGFTGIARCLLGYSNTAGGFYWKYEDDNK